MSSFVIKLIAIVSMLLDHSGDVFLRKFTLLKVLGRIAFPLFAFQLVIGYLNTRDSKKYLIRLLLFAMISQLPYALFLWYSFGKYVGFNIFFTLSFGLICMIIADYTPKHSFKSMIIPWIFKILSILVILILAQVLNFDYGYWGVLLILVIYIFYPNISLNSNKALNNTSDTLSNEENSTKSKAMYIKPTLEKLSKKTRTIIFILSMIIMAVIRYISYFSLAYSDFTILKRVLSLIIFTFLPTIIMLIYNGKKGPSMKYFFYLFYPVHLILILYIAFYFSNV